MMEVLTTGWGGLPSLRQEYIHFRNENLADRRMRYALGEAALESGWEESPAPLSWLQKVAWNKVRHRKTEDEKEFIESHEHGVSLVKMEDIEPAKSVRRSGARTTSRLRGNTERPLDPERSVELAPPVDDPLAAILPVSATSVDGLHLAMDVETAGRRIGLSEDAIRLLRAKATSVNRNRLAEMLGFDESKLKAKEMELRRAAPALREELSAYRGDSGDNH